MTHDEVYLGVFQNYGYVLGGPYNKGYSILESILGYFSCGKLPFEVSYIVILPGFSNNSVGMKLFRPLGFRV